MAILIDGYNLLYAAGVLPAGVGPSTLERSRRALLNVLAESIEPRLIQRTTVVFDAAEAPPGLPRKVVHRGLTVRYAANHADADTLIEELIEKDSAPRKLVVVSSDHRLHRAAKRRKAKPVDSDRWFAELIRSRQGRQRGRPPTLAKPTAPASRAEVEYWLEAFEAEAFFESELADEDLPAIETAPAAPSDADTEDTSNQASAAAATEAEESREAEAPVANEQQEGDSQASAGPSSRGDSPREDSARRRLDGPDIFPPGYGEDLDDGSIMPRD